VIPELQVTQKKSETRAIVHTERSELRDALRQELKAQGVKEIISPPDVDGCIAAIVQNAGIPLILDWEAGAADIVRILAASRSHFKIDTRPTFLVASQVSEAIIQSAYEYGVLHVHTGEISRQAIKEGLQDLLTATPEEKHISSILSSVAEARRRNEWAVSTPLLSSLAEKHPQNAILQCELAENLIHEQKWTEAIPLLEKHARGERPDVRAQHLLARCLLKVGQGNEAAKLLQSAKLLNPFNVDRLVELGDILLSQEKVEEAKEVFDEARTIAPRRGDATVGSAKCSLLQGEVNEALGLLKNISGPQELAAIFNTTAILAMKHGNHEKGMSLYQSALKAVGQVPHLQSRLHFNMGIGYKRWKKLTEALACFDKALSVDPQYDKAKKYRDLVAKAAASPPAVNVSVSSEITEETFESHGMDPGPAKVEIAPYSLDEDDDF